jgi:predicted ATPase
LDDPSRKFDAAWGLWLNRNVSGDLETAQALNDEIDSLASGMADPGFALQAHHAGFTTLYITGKLEAALKRTSALLELYSPQDHKEHAFRYGGHDPAVCGHCHGALSSWLLGYPDRALRLWKAGMELAESLVHPASMGVSKNFGSMLFQFLREPEQVQTLSVPAPGAPAHFQSMMLTAHGWALAQQGSVEEGLRECQRGVQGYRGTGARARLSYLQYLLADVLYLAGRPEDALAEVETAIDHAVDKATLADLYRLKGDALRTHSTPNVSSAERALSEALTMARRQRAKSWEIRSSTSLAQLYAAEGRPEKARDILTPIYNAFTEGLGTPDLLDARTILDELS